jgi:RES domain-containing protein
VTPIAGVTTEPITAWRLDRHHFAKTWDSGEGAYLAGGRWNLPGIRAVYCALDPATAILEIAAHSGMKALNSERRILTRLTIDDLSKIKIVSPSDIPNPAWLHPTYPSAGQQTFGAQLLADHIFVVLPSVVSTRSWNLIFDANRAKSYYALVNQEDFALDPRLDPPTK